MILLDFLLYRNFGDSLLFGLRSNAICKLRMEMRMFWFEQRFGEGANLESLITDVISSINEQSSLNCL